jgi:hypothetical protein
VLQSLKISVLESKERAGGFFGFVTGTNIDEEA